MAAAAVDSIPSYNRTEPGSCQLKAAEYPDVSTSPSSEDVDAVVSDWLAALTKALNNLDYSALGSCFLSGACMYISEGFLPQLYDCPTFQHIPRAIRGFEALETRRNSVHNTLIEQY